MSDIKKLKNKDLNNVTGGANLDDCLQGIKAKKDEVLVDYGTGTELRRDPSVHHDSGGNLDIVKRDKDCADVKTNY